MKQLLLLLILPFFCCSTQAQTKSPKAIKFTQAWIWEYENNTIAQNEPGHKGEMVVYFDPKNSYWLFTTEAYGNSGEMYDWIIGKPDGTYLLCASDEFGKKTIAEQKLKFPSNKTLPRHYKPTKNKKVFNQNKLGFPKIEGKEFTVNYTKTNDKTSVFIGDYKTNFLPLYFFNQLNTEAKLPVFFPVDFPVGKLLLEENSKVNRAEIRLRLKEISHTEYFIDLKTP